MTQYVALLRGIAPMNPNMRNDKLRGVCEELGFREVQTVISSGNVVFASDRSPAELEKELEAAWPLRLGFESTTIIRSRADVERLIDLAPFGNLDHGRDTYLLATFAKRPITVGLALPHEPAGAAYRLVAATERELFTVTDTTSAKTPDAMSWLEQQFGKDITSRTWLTVQRIVKKMGG